ncbi:MAG TPA: phospho-N-acetylmuramoyl-pentapeptide-transferase [Anaerohalosphaeraceae bacterium]|nr:phospho-N-acetylmuramoyl-pentapeptide-transferase [Anaerohalosphaeraceae bacterium]HOL89598.1 phospho-N-acetylmuramoyl-pentapeptide-transferase [Anaerohalosphaeraceae bacterium]HPP55086.1 phospho-N-acetylmuramoyl-pentapeptide-transferase [Anaerohalosphaeraceae bacterium]
MIYHLCQWLQIYRIGFYAYEDVLFRAIMAALTSWGLTLWLGPKVIRWLMRKKIGDRPEFHHAALNELMKDRANTPTMGGIIILTGILTGIFLWSKLTNPFVHKAIILILFFGWIGGLDDYFKLTGKGTGQSRDGLLVWQKLVYQLGGSLLVAWFLYSDMRELEDARLLWLPFYKHGIPLAGWMFVILSMLYITATSNAVNLTDGMDGLASGCIGIVSTVLVILCYIASETMGRVTTMTWAGYLLLPRVPGAGELCIFFAAITGSVLGFLWYNCPRALVFMGDIGSLPLGAAMGYGAIVTRNEILLLLIGGVFVMELGSVILQVGYFKYTKYKYSAGRKLFKCSPIHHHFHLSGWSEPQVVIRFWLLSIAFAILALATLKLR